MKKLLNRATDSNSARAAATRAEQLAMQVSGVRRMDNRLQIQASN